MTHQTRRMIFVSITEMMTSQEMIDDGREGLSIAFILLRRGAMRFNQERLEFLPGLCLQTAGRFERRRVYIYLVIVLKILAAMAILGWLVAALVQPQREVWSVEPSVWLWGAPLPRPKGTPALLTFVAGDHLYLSGGTWGPV